MLPFIVGLLCISFPFFVSGDILSTIVGAIINCWASRYCWVIQQPQSASSGPVLSGFLVAVAHYLLAISSVLAGTLADRGIYCRFVLCLRVICLMSWYRQRSMKGSWLQLVIGVLDIVIADILGAMPMVS